MIRPSRWIRQMPQPGSFELPIAVKFHHSGGINGSHHMLPFIKGPKIGGNEALCIRSTPNWPLRFVWSRPVTYE